MRRRLQSLKHLSLSRAGIQRKNAKSTWQRLQRIFLEELRAILWQYDKIRNYFGTSDVTIVAYLLNETMQRLDYASIWELKAPHCYLMEFDDAKTRCRPTLDLIKAENQLLHYGHESQNNDAHQVRLQIMDRDRIRLGGIVIGTRDKILKGATGVGDIERATNSFNIRKKYFYEPIGMKVVTWDRIIEYLRPQQA